MVIIQIILGNLPSHLLSCVDSVVSYAKRHGCKYQVFNSIPERFTPPNNLTCIEKFEWRRSVSDIMRLEVLAIDTRVLYADWDIFLYDDFDIISKDKMAFGGIREHSKDSLIYNGDETYVFQSMLKNINKPDGKRNHNLVYLINQYYESTQRFVGHYVHIDNCRFQNALDLI